MSIAKLKTKKSITPEAIVNDDPKLHSSFDPGDVAFQGDLIIVAINALPVSATPRGGRQLADGSTQGSRHILEHGDVYDCRAADVVKAIERATRITVNEQYIGPVFVSPESPTENDLTHPEHGNQGFPAGTICAVVFQRSLDSEEREQRVAD